MLAAGPGEVPLLFFAPRPHGLWLECGVSLGIHALHHNVQLLTLGPATGQVGKGDKARPARSPTAQEFVDFVVSVRAVMAAHFQHPLYIFDNPWFHVGKEATRLFLESGFPDEEMLKIPPYSPEFNKVVEHSHARLVPAVEAGVTANPNVWGFEPVCQIISEAFATVNTPEFIRRDTLTWTDTCDAIVEAEGGHIQHRFR